MNNKSDKDPLNMSSVKLHSILSKTTHQTFRMRLVLYPILLALLLVLYTSHYIFMAVVNGFNQYIVEHKLVLEPGFQNQLRIDVFYDVAIISIIFFIIVIFVGIFIINRLFEPIAQLTHAANRIAEGKWDVYIPQEAPGDVGGLTKAFDKLKTELRSSMELQEDRIAEGNRVLMFRNIQLHTAAEVAREVVATKNFDVLMKRAVQLIVERFGYYHVGIYLIDLQREYAILQAAPGETGDEMIAQGHRLRIDSNSFIGFVASTGERKLILDSEKNPDHFQNPYLTQTKSELVLPLVNNQRVIGVLDFHSDKPEPFTDEDTDILQILADQIAIAIDNAKLHQEHIDLMHQYEIIENQIRQQLWKDTTKGKRIGAYQFDSSGLKPLTKEDIEKDKDQPPYSLPIKVHGETVSYLDIWPADKELSAHELLLLDLFQDRVSQALESARLFEETQKRGRREQVVNDFVSKLSSSIDIDSLMQAAVKEFGSLPGIAEVEISIDPIQGIDRSKELLDSKRDQ